jgi:hypothetical protein
MKKQISLLLTFFSMAIMVHAQAPNAIPYQGVARNSSGSILASQAIRLRLTIHDVTAGGTTVYQETQAVTTSTLGLFNVNIGQGTIVTGTLAGVNWGGGAKFLQVEMDPTGGTNYVSMGTTQLNSVPYALFAGSIPNGAGWSQTGNSGTIDGTNFIGTTDNVPFNIRVNNQKAGRIDAGYQNAFYGSLAGNSNTTGGYNTAIGNSALFTNTTSGSNTAIGWGALYNNTASYNTALGYYALYSNTTGTGNLANGANALRNNTSGSYNLANGYAALFNNTTGSYNQANGYAALISNTTGSYNSAAGYAALYSNTAGIGNFADGAYALNANTSGSYNLATGTLSLYSNTIGGYNNANGYGALQSNTTGIQNTANGYQALVNNTTASNHTAIGYKSLYSNTTGSSNTGIGDSALYKNTTGGFNTAIGYAANSSNTNGSNNTAIGDSADVSLGTLNNATAIGYNAKVAASNTIQLGNTNIDSVMAGSLSANTKLVVPRLKLTGGALAANSVLTSDALGNATWQPSSLSGWSLTGNAGTNPANNFIGTTDNQPFTIRVNNLKAGRIDSASANSFYGLLAGGSNSTGKGNTAIGDSALFTNTTGSFNTSIGDSADMATSALTNATAIGHAAKAPASNTIQLGNAAIDSVMAGSPSDSTKLVVPRLRVTGGTPAVGQVLTAKDVNGNASWQTLPSGLPAATAPGQMLYWNGSAWVVVPIGTRGQTLTFCQGGVPTWGACPAITATVVTATPVTSITSSTATAGGNVTYDGDALITTSGVVYSTSPTPAPTGPTGSLVGFTVTTDGIQNAASGSWPSNLTGLNYATNYYVWAYATNSIGTAYGAQVSFTTLGTNASITTNTATLVASTTASTGGNIINNGGSTITVSGVVYSTSTIPTTGAPTLPHTTDGPTSGSWTSNLSGLTPGTLYNFRAYATNAIGTSYGSQLTFTTTIAPTLTTVAPTSVLSTTANPGGNISANGGATVTASGVIYSTTNTTPSLGSPYTVTTDGNTSSWASSLTGLTPATTYYAYAYATNSAGTSYGSQVSFTTTTVPTVTATAAISNIAANTASSGGTITSTGGAPITVSGVVWSTSNTAPSGSPGSLVGFGVSTDGPTTTGSWSNSSLTGLTGSTKYYVYAYATNSVGTTYGPQVIFTTTVSVGDSYQGGIVFYVTGSPGAQTGLIVATADQSTSSPWFTGAGPFTLIGASGTAIGTGSANTTTMLNAQPGNTGNAADACHNYGAGWYLPSANELNLLYPLRSSYGISMNGAGYWSSSEVDANTATAQAFGFGGSQSASSKNTFAAVRAIRSF